MNNILEVLLVCEGTGTGVVPQGSLDASAVTYRAVRCER